MRLAQLLVFFIFSIIISDLIALSTNDKKKSMELSYQAEDKLITLQSSEYKANTEIEQLLTQALTLNPQNRSALTLMGRYQWRVLNKHKEAERSFKQAIAIDENKSPFLNASRSEYASFIYFALKNKRKAMEIFADTFAKMTTADPMPLDKIYVYARLLEEQKKFSKAETVFEKILLYYADNPYAHYDYSQFLHRQNKNIDKADTAFQKALRLGFDNADKIGSYAKILVHEGELDGAETLYRLAIHHQKKQGKTAQQQTPKYKYNWTIVYARFLRIYRSDYEASDELYQPLIPQYINEIKNTNDINTAFMDYLESLCERKEKNKCKQAVILWQNILKQYPNNKQLASNYARFIALQPNFPNPLTTLQTLFKQDPNNFFVIKPYLSILNKNNDYTLVNKSAHWQGLLKHHTHNASVLFSYTHYLLNTKQDTRHLMPLWQSIVQKNPKDQMVLQGYADYLAHTDHHLEQSETILKSLVARFPQQFVYLSHYVHFLQTIKNDPKTAQQLLKNYEADPSKNNISLAYYFHLKRKNYTEAERLYKKVLQQDPNHVPVMIGLTQVLLLQGKQTQGKSILNKIIRNRSSNTLIAPDYLALAYFPNDYSHVKKRIIANTLEGVRPKGWDLTQTLADAKAMQNNQNVPLLSDLLAIFSHTENKTYLYRYMK